MSITPAVTAVRTLAEVTGELEVKNQEVAELNRRLTAARAAAGELEGTERELAVALAQNAPGAEDRIRALGGELALARARVAGLEQLLAAEQPALDGLRAEWTTAKRAEVRAQQQQEIARLTDELQVLDIKIAEAQAALDALTAERLVTFEKRAVLRSQQ